MNKKGVFSLFEIAFILILLGSISLYGYYELNAQDKTSSYALQAKSFLHSYNFTQQERSIIMNEDVSVPTVIEDWSTITGNFSLYFSNYGLYVGNITLEKSIATCSGEYSNSRSVQKILFSNNSVYTQRTLRLEVCY